MVDSIGGLGAAPLNSGRATEAKLLPAGDSPKPKKSAADSVALGTGQKVSSAQAQNILTERAYEKLRAVVSEARAELGLPEGGELDTSPEATANRIADFALGFFGKYAENNSLTNDEEGRRQYVGFIGKAVAQGIDEARGILGALNALNGDIAGNIDKTADVIQQRFEDFIANG